MDGRTYMPTTHIRRHYPVRPETIQNEAITNDFSKSFVPRTRRRRKRMEGTNDYSPGQSEGVKESNVPHVVDTVVSILELCTI